MKFGILLIVAIHIAIADPIDCWTRRDVADSDLFGVAFANGLWLVLGDDAILTSADGLTWTNRFQRTNDETLQFTAAAFGNDTFVAVGGRIAIDAERIGPSSIATSTNGIDWVRREPGVVADLYGLASGNGVFVAVGESPEQQPAILTSVDGITWTIITPPFGDCLSDVIFVDGTFVAAGCNGLVATSLDGTIWYVEETPSTSSFSSIAYGGGVYVTAGQGTAALTSNNSASWELRSLGPVGDVYSLAYGGGQFVAAAGVFATILTSTNGADWRPHRLAFGSLFQIAYGDGTFVGIDFSRQIFQSASTVTGAPPVIANQPRDQNVVAGLPIAMSVTQAGCSVPAFRWWKDGAPIAGATSNVLNIASATATNTGQYFVVLTDTFGAVTSRVARIQVVPPPVSLTLAGRWAGAANDVVVVSNLAYVLDAAAGLKVLDVADPTNVVPVGQYAIEAGCGAIYFVSNYVYLAEPFTGLHVIDVKNPSNPQRVGGYNSGTAVESFYVDGRYAYIWPGTNNNGLEIVDVADPASPVSLASIPLPDTAVAVQARSNYLYVLTRLRTDDADFDFLHVFDTSDVSHPVRVVDGLLGEGDPLTIRLAGNDAYIGGYAPALGVCALSNPTNPMPASPFNDHFDSDYSWDIVVRTPLVYSIGRQFRVFDVSDVSAPVVVASYAPILSRDDESVGIDLARNRAYVATGAGGLLVFDLVTPPVIESVTRSGDQIVVRWIGAPSRRLQRTPSLGAPMWTDVPGSLGQSVITVPLEAGSEFFRLEQ